MQVRLTTRLSLYSDMCTSMEYDISCDLSLFLLNQKQLKRGTLQETKLCPLLLGADLSWHIEILRRVSQNPQELA